MRKIALMICAAAVLSGCGRSSRKSLLPNVSGQAGEVMVVMEKGVWDGSTGETVRGMLEAECPFLPFGIEPLYSVVNITPGGFADIFRVHRNILIFNIGPQVDSCTVVYRKDVWSAPQCVIQLSARDMDGADSLLLANGHRILTTIEQAERDRVIAACIQFEQKNIAPVIRERFGGTPHIPSGYSVKKATDDFVWIADEKNHSIQGIFVYSYPLDSDEPFSRESIISHRNAVLQKNVPGMLDGSYMTTAPDFEPTVEFIRFRGRDFAFTRGMWEVHGDFMGGPFASQSFYSSDGSRIIVAEAWVYAPKFDKRQLLRQTESIIWSWEQDGV